MMAAGGGSWRNANPGWVVPFEKAPVIVPNNTGRESPHAGNPFFNSTPTWDGVTDL